MLKRIQTCSFRFGDEPKNITPPVNNSDNLSQEIDILQKTKPEVYTAIFGKGVTKGRSQITAEKFSELNDAEKAKLKSELRSLKIQNSLVEQALKYGFFNPSDAVDLLERNYHLADDLQVMDLRTNKPADFEKDLWDLAKKRPHLVKSTQGPGTGSRPPGDGGNQNSGTEKPTFKRSQLKDGKFYKDNKAAIELAIKENRIEDDLQRKIP